MKKIKNWMMVTIFSSMTLGSCTVHADDYPTRSIKVIVAYAVGSGADTIARILGEQLAINLNTPVVIENIAGAGGAKGTVAAARAASDGHTLLLAPTTVTVSAHMEAKPQYDPIKDFAPIMRVAILPLVLVVGPQMPFQTLGELIREAKKNPGKLNYATSGKGTGSHLEVELFARQTGIEVTEVPYKTGSQALTDVISGQVSFYLPVIPAAGQQILAGRMNALAIGTRQRSAEFPNIPTFAEALNIPDYEASVWYGLLAPAGTNAQIIHKLAAELSKILEMQKIKDKIAATGSEVSPLNSKEFSAFIQAESKKWGELVKTLGL